MRLIRGSYMPRANRRVVHEAPVNVDLPIDLVQELDAFIDRTGMKKKQCVELAIRRFIATEAKPSPGRRGAL